MTGAPHLLYLAYGFPPAAKSSAYRMREVANSFAERGWDVTVVTIAHTSWELEYGLDESLMDGVHPAIRIVEMPLRRNELETDIRRWPRYRARFPIRWRQRQAKLDIKTFPEPVFGRWRPVIEDTALRVHHEHPVDLCLVSPAPYTMVAGALRLHRDHGVPFAVDYRDGWSLDVLGGGEAFTPSSPAGQLEAELMAAARAVWVVNEPIREWYAARFPALGDRLRVVRNGFDPHAVTASTRRPDPAGLAFGYVGTVNFSVDMTRAILNGWRLARKQDDVIARSTLTFRGHMGAGHGRAASAHVRYVEQTPAVSYRGPVAKGDIAAVYASFDVLLLALAGGRFVTSGKVFEYAASGLPILSVHQAEHDAAAVLDGRPLWVRPDALDAEAIGKAFVTAAHTALSATDEQRAAARAAAERFERRRQIEPAVAELAAPFEARANR
ncbi:MAG: hypothetical protein QOG53_1092 [Frankiales bacterium]|jgi:glycosyltransferase involved in cell wall biosynthesis|nr:hypothetical protein [Frankiales bacterium]